MIALHLLHYVVVLFLGTAMVIHLQRLWKLNPVRSTVARLALRSRAFRIAVGLQVAQILILAIAAASWHAVYASGTAPPGLPAFAIAAAFAVCIASVGSLTAAASLLARQFDNRAKASIVQDSALANLSYQHVITPVLVLLLSVFVVAGLMTASVTCIMMDSLNAVSILSLWFRNCSVSMFLLMAVLIWLSRRSKAVASWAFTGCPVMFFVLGLALFAAPIPAVVTATGAAMSVATGGAWKSLPMAHWITQSWLALILAVLFLKEYEAADLSFLLEEQKSPLSRIGLWRSTTS